MCDVQGAKKEIVVWADSVHPCAQVCMLTDGPGVSRLRATFQRDGNDMGAAAAAALGGEQTLCGGGGGGGMSKPLARI